MAYKYGCQNKKLQFHWHKKRRSFAWLSNKPSCMILHLDAYSSLSLASPIQSHQLFSKLTGNAITTGFEARSVEQSLSSKATAARIR